MGLFSRFHKNEQKNNSESVSLSPEEKFKKMVPANPGIALNDDEVCLFMSDASIGKEKTRTTGYKSSGVSSRIHIAKGLSVGSSNVHVTPTRETYWEKTPCRFFVTDKRFIAISQKGGFNLKADKIIDIRLKMDCMFQKFYCWNIANMESTLNLLMGIRAFGGLIMECVM